MIFKVKHNELNQVSNTLKTDGEAYSDEISNMLLQIEKLRCIWQGEDAEIFCDNVSNYISKMNNMTIAMKNMSNVITTANNGYELYEDAFGEAMKAEADNYEE